MLECTQILSVYKMYFSRLNWFQLYALLADKIYYINFYPGALLRFPSSVSSLCSGLDGPFQFVQFSLVYSTTPNLSLQKLNRVISLISESSTRMKTGRKCWLWNENQFGKNDSSQLQGVNISNFQLVLTVHVGNISFGYLWWPWKGPVFVGWITLNVV